MDDGVAHRTIQLRTVRALCALRKWGDHFDYAVSQDRYIRLRVRGKLDDMYLAIQFPRSSEMTPHYKAIRDWFEHHRVEWKDRTHDGERFMTAELPLDPDWVDALMVEAGKTVFHADKLHLIIRTPLLYIEHVVARRPRLWFACVFLLFASALGVWVYEFSRGLILTSPALSNLSSTELVFAGLEIVCLTVVRSLLRRPVLNRRVQNAARAWAVRVFLFVPLILVFVTA